MCSALSDVSRIRCSRCLCPYMLHVASLGYLPLHPFHCSLEEGLQPTHARATISFTDTLFSHRFSLNCVPWFFPCSHMQTVQKFECMKNDVYCEVPSTKHYASLFPFLGKKCLVTKLLMHEGKQTHEGRDYYTIRLAKNPEVLST